MKLKLRTFFPLIVIAFIGCVVVWWKVTYPYGSWRYKITVEIETPEGVKSGSAVREVTAVMQPQITPETHPVNYGVIGEAVTIDLGNRGVVFALLGYTEVFKAFPITPKTTEERIKYYSTLPVGQKAVLTNYYPQIVTFENLNDPLTVKIVLGSRFNVEKQDLDPVNDFEALLGQGVKLKQVIIEITDEPLTWEIEKWLPWLPERKIGSLDGRLGTFSDDLASTLDYGNFKRENKYKKGER